MISQLILLGPPGSGKGTQAARLSQTYGLTKISTGDLIRNEISEQTPLGKNVQQLVNAGQLVPDDIITALFKNAVENAKYQFIADGFPRTLAQAETLDRILTKSLGYKVIFLNLDSDVLTQRILGRQYCPKCNQDYNAQSKPSLVKDRCDNDGEPLQRRKDDQLDIIQNRYQVYQKEIRPVLDFYKNELFTIDAAAKPDNVFTQISNALVSKVDA